MPKRARVDAAGLAATLAELGVRRDDVLWAHTGVRSALGMAGATAAEKLDAVLDGLDAAVPDGVLMLPTFTYSFTRGEDYDLVASPSTVGVLGDRLRARPGVRRTTDPLFSAAVRGALPPAWEERLFAVRDWDVFGDHGVFGLLREADARLLFLGVGFEFCTYVHHVEQRLGVGYRYPKAFAGTVRTPGGKHAVTATYRVRDLDAGVTTHFDPLCRALLDAGEAQATTLPGGVPVLLTTAAAVDVAAAAGVAANPFYLLEKGHASCLAT